MEEAPIGVCRALYRFDGDASATQIGFDEGETLEIIERVEGDWWWGTNAAGETGYFP